MLYQVKKVNNNLMDIRTESSKVVLIDTQEGIELASIDAREKDIRIKPNTTDKEKLSIMEFLRRWNVIKYNDYNEIEDKIGKLKAIILMRGYDKYNLNEVQLNQVA